MSLLTTTAGNEPHTFFGHSAIRITNEENDFDKLYNFGLFDFNAAYFPFKFIGGRLNYWLGRQTIEGFIEINNKERRLIKEQELNLPEKIKQAIFKALKTRHSPDNKFYRYSFTQKNCATEIRDLFYRFNVLNEDRKTNLTYRQLLNDCTTNHRWFRFGINTIMGTAVDGTIDYKEAMFIPAYLEKAVAEKPGLVSKNNTLNHPKLFQYNQTWVWLLSPLTIFSLMAIITFFWSPCWLRKTIYALIALLGILLILIWMTTLHQELTNNWNILWANPLFGLFLIANTNKFKSVISYVFLLCLGLIPVLWIIGIQRFDWPIIPIIVLLCVLILKENHSIRKEKIR